MGPQWFYLSVIDILGLSYLLYASKEYESAVKKLFSSVYTYLLLAFLTWATLSVTWAFNTTETWVCIARLLTTIVAFFTIFILIYNRKETINHLAYLLTITAIPGFFTFSNGKHELQ
jgi:hypothetical protein